MKLRYLLLLVLSLLFIPQTRAGLATGSWKQYPVHGSVTSLVDTHDAVWYVTGGCVYRYDKSADETRFFESGRVLSDNSALFLRYSHEHDIIAVAYESGNIDYIYPDGKIVNLSDIKDTQANITKTINDIVFDGDDMYVAMASGIVLYNVPRAEVIQSGIYDMNVQTVIPTPEYIFFPVSTSSAATDWMDTMYRIPRTKSLHRPENCEMVNRFWCAFSHPEPLDEERRNWAMARAGRLGYAVFNADGSWSGKYDLPHNGNIVRVKEVTRSAADGVVRFLDLTGQIGHFTDNSSFVIDATLPESFKGNLMSAYDGLKSVWLADINGVGNYRIDNDGLTVLRDKGVSSDAITFSQVCNFFPTTNDPSSFYIANLGLTANHPVTANNYSTRQLSLNRITPSGITNIDPVNNFPSVTAAGASALQNLGPHIFAPTQIAEDPDVKGRLFIGSGDEGVYVVEDDRVVVHFNSSNSPLRLYANWFYGVTGVSIDQEGNLWVGFQNNDASAYSIIMLPASVRKRNDLSTVTAADWKTVGYEGAIGARDIQFLHCKHSPMRFIIDSLYEGSLLAINTNSTPGNTGDDKYTIWKSLSDQDGRQFHPLFRYCMIEDNRGHVWIGTSSGVIAITSPTRAVGSDMQVQRIKVPRTDGSGLADYLLDGETITAMTVDNSNRKWIGTAVSGLFLVSEDGDRIISNFTTDNSPLPSNCITALWADPTSSSIMIGTLAGLYEYSSTSGPANDDFKDVYAYPNPVTPDYSGWITIAGLMNNSLVKIMDSAMHLVYQTTSEGGMAMWDGCNLNGARVRSGVYYVLASSGSDTSSQGDVVAKILVVN